VSPRHPLLTGVAITVGWGAVGVLWITTVARIVAWDKLEMFAVLDAYSLVLFLPAWPIAAVAAWRRRWLLSAAALAMIVAQIVFVSPELLATTALPRDLRSATTIRILDANVYQDNPSMAGYAREIRHDRPDLVTLEEASPFDLHQLSAAHALANLPYEFWNRGFGSRSLIIASHYPLGPTTASSVDGLPFLARTTVTLPQGHLDLWVVHTTAPIDPGVRQWNDELNGVARLLRADHPRPLLMVGDFNATWNNRGFRQILSDGLTDAAAARGDALAMTWSQLTSPLPPLIRIDHVLSGPGVVVTSIQTEPGPGSDHRDLSATVAVLPRAARH
jgi:endonuclease/exonuclease/phosphatase (EEP) superfamily protein YafD